jgi:hypothetical protein
MIATKIFTYARKLGIDTETLLEMTFLDALEYIDSVESLWKDIVKDAK